MTMQPPAAAAPTALPSQDDRMLAAVAHLSFVTGFWLAAPIAIYVIKRKESRFVAFHALQAAMIQVLFGVGTAFFVLACFFLTATAGLSGRHELVALASLVPFFGVFGGGFGLLAMHLVAAYSAWRGQVFSIPIAGHLARSIMAADEGAAKV
jgi:uncharacterized membrane protein